MLDPGASLVEVSQAVELPGSLIETLHVRHAAVFFATGFGMALDQAEVW